MLRTRFLMVWGVLFCLGCGSGSKTDTNSEMPSRLNSDPETTNNVSQNAPADLHQAPHNIRQSNNTPKERPMNALANSQSPYLLQHAENPVNWVEWGDEAFAVAKKEGKPILLSIGYSTCHWCHVMAHESFEDEAVADYINENFIAIKLDREERPDIDRIYMTYVQATTGHGGWPMTVFLTPQRVPFYGGTYFPKARFMELLKQVSNLWGEKAEELEDVGQQFVDYLQKQVSETAQTDLDSKIGSDLLLKNVVDTINRQYDETYAGFGAAPKFPRPVLFAPLITYARFHAQDPIAKQAMERTVATLHAMANGGMYDHIGGGFHRYSVDKYWHVPHFEKMMYDQGQLAAIYADVGSQTNDTKLIAVAEDICNYVQQRMTDKTGALYSAEDADSLTELGGHESKEGAYYVWDYKELLEQLGEEEAKLCLAYFQSTEKGNVRPESDPQQEFIGQNVFTRVADAAVFAEENKLSLDALNSKIATWRNLLYKARSKRPSPHLDDKILVAWNGLMISGFVRTYVATGNQSYLQSAEAAVAAIRNLCWDNDEKILYRLFRGTRGSVRGFADDYAMLIQALLDLHEANGDASSLRFAIELQQILNKRFAAKAGGWYETDGEDRSLLSRMQESYEGAEPSANSVALRNCLRLASLLGEEDYAAQASKTMARFSGDMQQQSQALPSMISSTFLADHKGPTIVIVEGKQLEELRAVFHKIAVPGSTLLTLNEETRKLIEAPWIKSMKNRDGAAQAFLCKGKTCKAPTTDTKKLRQQLEESLPGDTPKP